MTILFHLNNGEIIKDTVAQDTYEEFSKRFEEELDTAGKHKARYVIWKTDSGKIINMDSMCYVEADKTCADKEARRETN